MSERAALPDLDTLNPEALKALIVAQHEATSFQRGATRLARRRDRAAEAVDRQAAAHAVRAQVGEAGLADRAVGVEAGRTGSEPSSRQLAASPTPMAASVVNRAAKRARQPLPAHLPRETHKVLPKQEACPDCGGALKPLGEDVSEILEYVPEHFKVIRQVRPKLACACCDKIVQAEAPSRPIERGMAGPGLLAHVLVSKYC